MTLQCEIKKLFRGSVYSENKRTLHESNSCHVMQKAVVIAWRCALIGHRTSSWKQWLVYLSYGMGRADKIVLSQLAETPVTLFFCQMGGGWELAEKFCFRLGHWNRGMLRGAKHRSQKQKPSCYISSVHIFKTTRPGGRILTTILNLYKSIIQLSFKMLWDKCFCPLIPKLIYLSHIESIHLKQVCGLF